LERDREVINIVRLIKEKNDKKDELTLFGIKEEISLQIIHALHAYRDMWIQIYI
jgi:hypothetical protein